MPLPAPRARKDARQLNRRDTWGTTSGVWDQYSDSHVCAGGKLNCRRGRGLPQHRLGTNAVNHVISRDCFGCEIQSLGPGPFGDRRKLRHPLFSRPPSGSRHIGTTPPELVVQLSHSRFPGAGQPCVIPQMLGRSFLSVRGIRRVLLTAAVRDRRSGAKPWSVYWYSSLMGGGG
jgi:hypothetical protein